VPVNPTRDLELPVPERREVEIVLPSTAARLLAALPESERAIWATALYAGLRSGELRALRWSAVDLSRNAIEVRESWDPKEGPVEPKTRRSRRRCRSRTFFESNYTVCGGTKWLRQTTRWSLPPDPRRHSSLSASTATPTALGHHAGIRERLRLHQARHTYASFMIAAGINAKALSSFMGHASITVTFDLYAHLMPGSEAEGAALLDAYLDGQSGE
jgi:integrase